MCNPRVEYTFATAFPIYVSYLIDCLYFIYVALGGGGAPHYE